MNDVPRTENGWPTIPVEEFTEEQLRREGERWRRNRDGDFHGPHTVGYSEWRKYATELYTRGLIPAIDVRIKLYAS